MNYTIERRIEEFLSPYNIAAIKEWRIIEKKYELRRRFILYNQFTYKHDFKNDPKNILYKLGSVNFDGDYPEDVLEYIDIIDRLTETEFALTSLFRKLTNEHGTGTALQISNHISELPKYDFVANYSIVSNLQLYNKEQIETIHKANIDFLLLPKE